MGSAGLAEVCALLSAVLVTIVTSTKVDGGSVFTLSVHRLAEKVVDDEFCDEVFFLEGW